MGTKFPFPFVKLSPQSAMWGDIPGDNFEETVDQCPTEFLGQNVWSEAAKKIFFHEDLGEIKAIIDRLTLITSDPELATVQRTYLLAWIMNERAVFDVKMSVCGWVLSLMVEECPTLA